MASHANTVIPRMSLAVVRTPKGLSLSTGGTVHGVPASAGAMDMMFEAVIIENPLQSDSRSVLLTTLAG